MNDRESYLWVEKYRPQTVKDCILPNRLKNVFQEYVNKKRIPHLLLCGSAGVGKTTVAIAMCKEIGLNYILINSSEERGITVLRTKIVGFASTVSLTETHKVIILDEADGLTAEAQDALRGAMEQFSSNCTFILTCNHKAKIQNPIHSRSSVVDFTLRKDEKAAMAAKFYKRMINILDKEGVSYENEVIAKITDKYFPDYRRTLNELQRYASLGDINNSVISQLSDVKQISELVGFLSTKNFKGMRKWVVENSDVDTSSIYRKIYDSLSEKLKPQSIPQAIIILARYQYQSAFVADQEINLVACLTEIMVDCEFGGTVNV